MKSLLLLFCVRIEKITNFSFETKLRLVWTFDLSSTNQISLEAMIWLVETCKRSSSDWLKPKSDWSESFSSTNQILQEAMLWLVETCKQPWSDWLNQMILGQIVQKSILTEAFVCTQFVLLTEILLLQCDKKNKSQFQCNSMLLIAIHYKR